MRKLTEKQTKKLQDGFDAYTEKLRKGMEMKKMNSVTIERKVLEGLTPPEGFKSWDDWFNLYNNTDVESKWRLLKLASECAPFPQPFDAWFLQGQPVKTTHLELINPN